MKGYKSRLERLAKILAEQGKRQVFLWIDDGRDPKDVKREHIEKNPQDATADFILFSWNVSFDDEATGTEIPMPESEPLREGPAGISEQPPGVYETETALLEEVGLEGLSGDGAPLEEPEQTPQLEEVEPPPKRHRLDRLLDEVDNPKKVGNVIRLPRKYRKGPHSWMV